MGLRKCPRCELNYIRDDEKYCNVCKRYMKGEHDAEDGVSICVECGENPAVKGSELCAICLREARRQEKLEKVKNGLTGVDALDIDEVAMADIEVPLPGDSEDIPESELEVIDKELGDDDDEADLDEEEENGEAPLNALEEDDDGNDGDDDNFDEDGE
ncbi:MAG TPA: hypothetical protein VN512_05805 [Clostridia bacterium]|nr:hypothetical protein [Clostridia bacterium]